jgi:hypothetical protein
MTTNNSIKVNARLISFILLNFIILLPFVRIEVAFD